MTRKHHNHRPGTNPRHPKEEIGTEHRRHMRALKIIKVKQSAHKTRKYTKNHTTNQGHITKYPHRMRATTMNKHHNHNILPAKSSSQILLKNCLDLMEAS